MTTTNATSATEIGRATMNGGQTSKRTNDIETNDNVDATMQQQIIEGWETTGE